MNTFQHIINKCNYWIINLKLSPSFSPSSCGVGVWGVAYGQRVEAVSGGGNPQWSALICHRYAAEAQGSC